MLQITAYQSQTKQNEAILNKLELIITQILKHKQHCIIALSGGKSPKMLLEQMSLKAYPWDRIIITLVDDRFVNDEHEDSNAKLIKGYLLQNKASQAPFISLINNKDKIENAKAEINAQQLAIDVAILGMGEDGHTASIFPECDELEYVLNTDEQFIITTPKVASHKRLGLSLNALIKIPHLILSINTPEKLNILKRAALCATKQYPISYLLKAKPDLEVYSYLNEPLKTDEIDIEYANSYPRLISDIGGTNARFSIEISKFKYDDSLTRVYKCAEFENIVAAVSHYLDDVDLAGKIHNAAITFPAPTVDDNIYMINSPWPMFSMRETRKQLAIKNLIFLNDFHALALAIPHIPQKYLIPVGAPRIIDEERPRAIIGPGTGLGVASLIKLPLQNEYKAIPAEGGRASFSPVNQEEIELWNFVHKRFSHVSVERFISGPGLQLIYEGLCYIQGHKITQALPTPSQITDRGINSECWICKRSVDIFCRMLGTVASNLAVMENSFGGVYIGGGIIPKILDYFLKSEFRSRFEDKGRYRPFLAKMPVFVITQEFPAFLGASYALETYINKHYIP